jgi:phosphatidylinositol alpha-mannosyltransferase
VSPYDHAVSGGVREHVIHLAAQHRALGHDVTIVAPASDPEALRHPDVRISGTVAPVPGAGSIARISLSPAVVPRLRRLLREGRFDVVHIHEPLTPLVGLAALVGAPPEAVRVGTIHGYRPRLRILRVLNRPLSALMGRLDARVAVSVDAGDWAGRYFPGRYHIISDGVDVERFADPTVKPIDRFDDGRPNVLFVGRLEPRKGFRHLLDAFPAVQRAVPGTRLLVVGHYGDAQRRRWQAEAASRGVTDVELVGFVPDQDMPRWYRTAEVFCAPSTGYEALGIVLLEAMASGTALVTTDIEGYRTVVTPGRDALVVPPGDPRALADALVRVLSDPELSRRLVERAQQRVRDYDWPVLAARLIEVYQAHR